MELGRFLRFFSEPQMRSDFLYRARGSFLRHLPTASRITRALVATDLPYYPRSMPKGELSAQPSEGACLCQKLNRPQRADYSRERRRTERPAEWTRAPHLMESGVRDTPVLTCAASSRNGIDSGWGETPFLSENRPSRRPPLLPVMESTDFRKFKYGTALRRLNGA